jgi:hypothetical protein
MSNAVLAQAGQVFGKSALTKPVSAAIMAAISMLMTAWVMQ